MRIPKKFKLNNKTWEVSVKDKKKFKKDERLMGVCYRNLHKIFINPSLTRNEIEETFVHELLHACWPPSLCSNKLEEKLVEKLAVTLYATLKKNKKLLSR